MAADPRFCRRGASNGDAKWRRQKAEYFLEQKCAGWCDVDGLAMKLHLIEME